MGQPLRKKICRGCHEEKYLRDFEKHRRGFRPSDYKTLCKVCMKEWRAADRLAKMTPEQVDETQRQQLLQSMKGCEEYMSFEPFDVEPRPDWVLELAERYDAKLNPDGNPFQAGVIMDCTKTPFYTISIAGSQTGKSRPLLIESIIMMSGKIPISMQFDKGVDTGIPRQVNEENIIRFGRREDGGCGNIIGVGKYPQEKIPPPKSMPQIWIASLAEVKSKMWQTRLLQLIPEEFLDTRRSNRGWSERYQCFRFKTGAQIRLITYEQKYKKAEGEMAWMIILDEEPPVREYFISAVEHCRYLRICYSPINGLGWSFFDCYEPAIKDEKQNIKIYSCSQYDSPYQDNERVNQKLDSYKIYEVKSRIFGQYTEMVGMPYYSYELTQQFLNTHVPRHTLAKISPVSNCEMVRDALESKMREEPAETAREDVWEIYEKYNDLDTYWMAVDVAEGHDNPDLAQDKSVAYVRRLQRENEKDPVMVAALHSTVRNVDFAWLCLYAACYYNYCLVAPETGASADGAVFVTTLLGYPYIYRHVTVGETYRTQERLGFSTQNSTRKYCFDLITTWIQSHQEHSGIYHFPLLKEMAECVVGKGGRPDHTARGSTDCLMAYGISEYVYSLAKNQIKRNRKPANLFGSEQSDEPLFPNIRGLNATPNETRPVLGSRVGMDRRFGVNQGMRDSRRMAANAY